MSAIERIQSEEVKGFLHLPDDPSGLGLVLTHGAGANCQSALLLLVATEFCRAGWHVLRCDLPFRQHRPFGPPHPSQAAADRAGLKQAAMTLRQRVTRVALGGHSYGGRQASMLAAEDPSSAEAVLLLSYPLHPPKQPEKSRTAHFPQLRIPLLFVHGSSDLFGSLDEMNSAIESIPAPHALSVVENEGHDLAKGRFDISGKIVRPFAQLLHDILDA